MEEPTMMHCPYCNQYHNVTSESELEQCPLNPNRIAHTLLNAAIELDAQTRAVIDQAGRLIIHQEYDSHEMVSLSAQAAYELYAWLADNHADMLRQIAREQQQEADSRPGTRELPEWIKKLDQDQDA